MKELKNRTKVLIIFGFIVAVLFAWMIIIGLLTCVAIDV